MWRQASNAHYTVAGVRQAQQTRATERVCDAIERPEGWSGARSSDEAAAAGNDVPGRTLRACWKQKYLPSTSDSVVSVKGVLHTEHVRQFLWKSCSPTLTFSNSTTRRPQIVHLEVDMAKAAAASAAAAGGARLGGRGRCDYGLGGGPERTNAQESERGGGWGAREGEEGSERGGGAAARVRYASRGLQQHEGESASATTTAKVRSSSPLHFRFFASSPAAPLARALALAQLYRHGQEDQNHHYYHGDRRGGGGGGGDRGRRGRR